jgi:hypothetical protein
MNRRLVNFTLAFWLGFVALAATRAYSAETPNALTATELAEGWILLFDGETPIAASSCEPRPSRPIRPPIVTN